MIPFHTLPDNALTVDDVRENVDEILVYENITRVMEDLMDREKYVLSMSFWKDMNLSEIAKSLGLSRERIRQIEAKAIRKLRHSKRSVELRKGLPKCLIHMQDNHKFLEKLRLEALEERILEYKRVRESHERWKEYEKELRIEYEEIAKKKAEHLKTFSLFKEPEIPQPPVKHPARHNFPAHLVILKYNDREEPYLALTQDALRKGYVLSRNIDPESYDRWLQQAVEEHSKSAYPS